MIAQARRLFITCLVLLVTHVQFTGASHGEDVLGTKVIRVVDGDTFEIEGGDRVRLLGIDAPERGARMFTVATERLRQLTAAHKVTLEICEERDTYGRFLATVRAGGVNVNSVLLREGMALPMLIPPCGRAVAGDVLRAAAQGALLGKGIYSLDRFRVIPHSEAGNHLGERTIVRGRILNLHRGPKAWHLNFGQDWKRDFTVVIFREGLKRFSELGLDPALLVGSEVLVIGKLRSYNGPEIIISGPDQILPLEGKSIRN